MEKGKAKTDPLAPASVIQLLDEIESISSRESFTSFRNNSDQVSVLVSILERSLQLAYDTHDTTELVPSFLKYSLDALRLWAIACCVEIDRDSKLQSDRELREALFDQAHQLRVQELIWTACSFDSPQVFNRSKACLEKVLDLVARLSMSTEELAGFAKLQVNDSELKSKTSGVSKMKKKNGSERRENGFDPFPSGSSLLLTTLCNRSINALERKQGPLIIEVLVGRFGSAPFLKVMPSSTSRGDWFYSRLIHGLDSSDGGASRKGKIATSYLKARAQDIGCELSSTALRDSEQAQRRWEEFSKLWMDPLTEALQHGDDKLRAGLASYHLGSLFEMDSRCLGSLLDHLLGASTINLEGIFICLKLAKALDMIQVKDVDDFVTEKAEEGRIPKVSVPARLLLSSVLSATTELQISTLALVIESKAPATPLSAPELSILKKFFPYSLSITNPGARGEVRGFFVRLLTRLRASAYALARDSGKIERIQVNERLAEEVEKLARMRQDLDNIRIFLGWLFDILKRTLHPGASYQACITALTFLDLILESGVDPRYIGEGPSKTGNAKGSALIKNAGETLSKTKQTFTSAFPFELELISPALVELLLSCSTSTFGNIQLAALTMLAKFPAPLPGLETKEAADQRIIGKAAKLMTSTRDYESAAAARLVQLYKSVYIEKLGWEPSPLLDFVSEVKRLPPATDGGGAPSKFKNLEVRLIDDHLTFLEHQLEVAESGRVLEAATSHPVHGTLVTLQELFVSLQMKIEEGSNLDELKQTIERARLLIDRTWQVTRGVLCSSAPEGAGAGNPEDELPDGLVQPVHETENAMQAAEDEDDEQSSAGPKHQVILSYCWRGMKEASALLGTLVSSTLRNGNKEVWSASSIGEVGSRFNVWLTQVRHRGAFSTIYPAYCDAALAIVKSRWAEIDRLPSEWIQSFLDAVAEPGTKLSTTRRSAGIGYAVLALLIAHPNRTDKSVLRDTMGQLIAISQRNDKEGETQVPVSAIHAINIIRVLVSDGQLSEHMSEFIGTLLQLAISKFSSPFWGIRNVAMILFSSLCTKCFSSRYANKDVKAARLPTDDFFHSYNGIDRFLKQALTAEVERFEEREAKNQSNTSDHESSLFAILMLFSRMQAPEAEASNPDHQRRMSDFTDLIERCAKSRVWKIREMAARAYTAVIPGSTSLKKASELLRSCSTRDQNTLHGFLLLVRRCIYIVENIESKGPDFSDQLKQLLCALSASCEPLLARNRCFATNSTFLDVVLTTSQLEAVGSDSKRLLLSQVEPWARKTIVDFESEDVRRVSLKIPGGPALLSVSTRLVIESAKESLANSTKTYLNLLGHPSEDVRLSTLQMMSAEENVSEIGSEINADTLSVGRQLHQMAKDESEGVWVRISSSEVLHKLCSSDWFSIGEIFSSRSDPSDGLEMVKEGLAIATVTKRTTCVPLREALMPYLSNLCCAIIESRADPSIKLGFIDEWAIIVSKCADEKESVQSRESAAISIRTMGRHLFPHLATMKPKLDSDSFFAARIAAIRLLVDDDEDVRQQAAAMAGETIFQSLHEKPGERETRLEMLMRVARGEGSSSEVSSDKAWQWMSIYYSDLEGARGGTDRWSECVWSELVPERKDTVQAFEKAFNPSKALFADEAPNQFRDPEVDVRRAYRYICDASVKVPEKIPLMVEEAGRNIEELATNLGLDSSHNVGSGLNSALGLTRESIAVHILGVRSVLAVKAMEKVGIEIGQSRVDSATKVATHLGIKVDRDQDADMDDKEVPEVPRSQGRVRSGGGVEDLPRERLRIAMISDFFYPNVGGVEGHIYLVSQRLLELGHKVIVITHAYGPDRVGIRHLSSGLKVYYVPYKVIARQDTLPNFFGLFPLLRNILIRERIQVVHGHQALSSMAHEGILHARTMGLKTVFTDHSLFGFADAASILTNKLLKFVLADVDHVVCVSHTGKENTVLRASLDPTKVSVIPNAVVAKQFQPDPATRHQGISDSVSRASGAKLTIVVLSRLMYRKGIDLLIGAIPRLCKLHPDIQFLIGGDGPKRVELEQMRERFMIQDRVQLVGAVRQGDVRSHLTRGQIFLNTSLTEAFGTGIIEAACCGLFVVSTRVGGIPEILPHHMIRLARPEEDDIVRATNEAIDHIRRGRHDPIAYHESVRQMYSWEDVSQRLEKVYLEVLHSSVFPSRLQRFIKYNRCGPIAGKIFCIIVAVDMIFLFFLELFNKVEDIDLVPSVHDPPGTVLWEEEEAMEE
ncbi:hypothetical protein IE53DRAFT_55942 [Violaceomyces palustris]|uniref:Uncharacterized protein n=1 Tax=Violaceomyces palustris TaxID=1673888 RepID=A0ACD0NZP0_9BASI|nr:hypothetical protein IE53DRAFT_55942 [Violaceomyces palustris]